MDARQAAAEAARRRVRRAAGLLREASRDLAAATGGDTALGVIRAHDPPSAQSAHDLIALGIARHGAVDVVVVARPTGRAQPPHGPDGAKENTNGTKDDPRN